MFFHNDLRYIVGKRSTIILLTHENDGINESNIKIP